MQILFNLARRRQRHRQGRSQRPRHIPSHTESYGYTPPGGKKAVPFTITGTPGESAEDKADAIVTAIAAIPGSAASKDNNTKHPEEINVGGPIALVKSTSGETDSIFALGPAGPGSFVTIAFGGGLTGVPFGDGATAMHEASGLPSSLQGNLNVDLSTDTIRFDLPNSAKNPFVAGNSSDQSVFYAETLVTAVPEPSCLSLVSMGGFCVIASAWRRLRNCVDNRRVRTFVRVPDRFFAPARE